MDFNQVFGEIAAGLLVTDADFKVIWANKFEEEYYKKPVLGLDVVDCHKEANREKIRNFLQQFKSGEIKQYTKTAGKMLINYSSYYIDGQFAGIVRTRMRMV